MRIQTTANLLGVDRVLLERWMRRGLVTVVMAGQQRTIPHTELPLLKLLPPLVEAGFTDHAAFELATAMLTAPPTQSGWSFPLTDRIRVHIAKPTRAPAS